MMKTDQSTAVVVLFSAIFMVAVPLSSYAGQMKEPGSGESVTPAPPPTETAMHDTKTTVAPPSDAKGAAKGCATGAAIGTILFPGVGTLAGCALVSVVGWFW